jgi:hypothetical protein
LEGSQLWISDNIDGEAVGTPLISDNGKYVFLNVNQNGSFGFFTILSAVMGGSRFFNRLVTTCPFAPPGIFHNPVQGYYDGGAGNTNDIIMWSCDARAPFLDFGGIFAFQFPVNFADDALDLDITFLRDASGEFWGRTPPVLTNGGLSAYWTSSGSRYYTWVGESGLAQNQFDRDPTAFVEFTRGGFQRQPVYAPPALSSDPLEPMIFGGAASAQFVRLNYDYSESLVIDTSSIVQAKAIVSPADDFVYYVESGGIIHQAHVSDLSDNWSTSVSAATVSEIALDSSGLLLYVGDESGTIRSYFVGDVDSTRFPTTEPSIAPSTEPPVLQCGGYASFCVSATDCCSNRCVLGTCQKEIDTQKMKIGGGRGGAGGGNAKVRGDSADIDGGVRGGGRRRRR